jgi:hypothetical protein
MPLVIRGEMVEVTMAGGTMEVTMVVGTMVGGTMEVIGLDQVMRFTHIRFIPVRLATDGIRTCIRTVSCLPERGGRAGTLENVF